jgi:hypothetical protein
VHISLADKTLLPLHPAARNARVVGFAASFSGDIANAAELVISLANLFDEESNSARLRGFQRLNSYAITMKTKITMMLLEGASGLKLEVYLSGKKFWLIK